MRLFVRALAVALFATALLPAPSAQAAARTVQGGRLDWGIKSSFQSYVTGPIANGSYSLTGGAATVGSSQFRFHSATGSYNGTTGAFTAAFSGGVHFVGHREDNGSYQLDLTISRPTVRISSGGSGTLYVDITSRAKDTGKFTSSSQVAFATLALGGINMRGDGDAVTLNNLPATLTAQGAKSFAGYYTAGTRLDPVSLSTDVEPKPKATKSTAKATATATKPSAAKTTGKIQDGVVDWGVRRTFREYVTGEIAQGQWKLSGGAQDGGALFRFPKGTGTYDSGKQTLTAEFTGSLRFTGDHGLDLTLSAPTVRIKAGKGTLAADVTSGGTTTAGVPLVTFRAGALKARNGLVTVSEAPASLTADGAGAFDSLYPEGTAMDPVTVAVALTDSTRLPALPDLGSEASPTPEPTKSPAAAKTVSKTEAAADSSDAPVLPIGLAAAGVLLAAGAAYALLRARRRTPAADDTAEQD
jgi:hypothetical protein